MLQKIGMVAFLGMCAAPSLYAVDTPNNITLAVGQKSVQVSLPANATTGYQWFAKDYNQALLHLKSYQYDAHPAAGKVGVGGTAIFTFVVDPKFYIAPQTTDVVFVYKQPWSPDMQGAKVMSVMISSVPGSN